MGKQIKTIFGAAFALLGLVTLVAVVADRIMDNPAQRSPSDHKT